MPLKIAMLLSNPLEPDPRVENEAESLAKVGHSVEVIAWDREQEGNQIEERNGFVIERTGPKALYSLGLRNILPFFAFWAISFFRLLKKDFDVVHCHDFDTLLPGFFAAKLKGKKIVYDSHDFYSWLLRGEGMHSLSWIVSKMEQLLAKRVDRIITVSEPFEKKFLGMQAEKILVLQNCKPLGEYNVSGQQIASLKKMLNAENKKIFLYIGNLCKGRMLLEFMQIFNSIATDDCLLVIGGEGVLEKTIAENASKSKSIVFVGKTSAREVPLYSKAARCLLAVNNPANLNYKYTIQNKFFEAIAAGKPIIIARGSYAGAEAEKLGFGLQIEYGNAAEAQKALKAVSSKALLYKKLSANALIARESLNWEKESLKLIELYSELEKSMPV